MVWALAGKIALAAGQAFMSFMQARSDDEQREADRELLLAAINRLRDELLERLNELEVNELRGELEGFRDVYQSYDADPSDPVEEQRLANLADDAARVLGRLGADLDSVGSNPDLALEAWSIYVPLLYLRAQAMMEREITYGADEAHDALPSFDLALPRLDGLLAHLRRVSDNRFGEVVCKPMPDSQDRRVCWFMWGNSQFICGSLNDPRGVEKCQARRKQLMDRAYRAYPGVGEITGVRHQLQDARDALDTIDALGRLRSLGVDVGQLVLAHGRLARQLPSRDEAPGAPGRRPRDADWFS